MLNQEPTPNAQKVPLSTRIPENIDLRIEQVVQSHGIKKQELIAHILELGLSKIHELEQTGNTDISSKSNKNEERSLGGSENLKILTQDLFISKTLEDLLNVSNDIKACLLSIKNLSEENVKCFSDLNKILMATYSKMPDELAIHSSKDERTKSDFVETTLTPDFSLEEMVKKGFSELQQAISMENLSILRKLEFFEQKIEKLQKAENTVVHDALHSSLDIAKTNNSECLNEVIFQNDKVTSNSKFTQLQAENEIPVVTVEDQDTSVVILEIAGQSYFTLTEVYRFAQLAGYSKHFSSFRDLFIENEYSQQNQSEWGIKLDISRYSKSKGCRYIYLCADGKLAKAILASLDVLKNLDFTADPSTNPICPVCNSRMRKNGKHNGKQYYICSQCSSSKKALKLG
jgi:hypothetical protein